MARGNGSDVGARQRFDGRELRPRAWGPAVTVAALYVEARGVYSGREGVEVWDAARDARGYSGPWSVVAHPPCARWGRYWSGGPSHHGRFALGDDGGCFAAALASVRVWGGVLEHPEASHAWRAHGLLAPPRWGGWVAAGDWRGWTCCVEQGAYGHRARKATWLYAVGVELPRLRWGSSGQRLRCAADAAPEVRRAAVRASVGECVSAVERAATPREFAELLLGMARTAGGSMLETRRYTGT